MKTENILNDDSLEKVSGGNIVENQTFYVGQVLGIPGYHIAIKVKKIRASGFIIAAYFSLGSDGWSYIGEQRENPNSFAGFTDLTNDPEFEFIKNYEI